MKRRTNASKSKRLPRMLLTGPCRTLVAALALAAFAGPALAVGAGSGEVNVYSYRQEVLIRPLLDRFTELTGVKVNVVFAKNGMIERLKTEGPNSPADAILTVDAGRLIRARQAGVLQPIRSPALERAVPAQYRDPEGYWYALSVRARPIMYSAERVDPKELSSYADLTDPKWKGRICIRSSGNIYNQSMLAAFIAHMGAAKAEDWARRFVANFARTPKGGDRDQIRAVAAGECDLAIANTYYLAGLAKSKRRKDREVAAKVRVFWPDQQGHGAHVNISGAAVTRSAKHKADAIRLIEYLVSDEAQKIYAEVVNEYPVVQGVQVGGVVATWGVFKADRLNLSVLAKHNSEAVRIADRAGWR